MAFKKFGMVRVNLYFKWVLTNQSNFISSGNEISYNCFNILLEYKFYV